MSDLVSPGVFRDSLDGDAPPVVIDVRSQAEYDGGCLPGALLIPADELPDRLDEIPAGRSVVTY